MIVVIAICIVLFIVAALMFFSAPEPPLKMLLAVQDTPTAGEDLALQVTLTSASARDVTLVAELFNNQRQLVNIARETTSVSDGDSILVVRLKLPSQLPQGRYTAVMTARYDKTNLLTQDISVRVVEPKEAPPVVTPPATPPVPAVTQPEPSVVPVENVSPVTPAQPETPPEENRTTGAQNATVPESAVQPVPGSDVPLELEDIADLAKTDKQKALEYCDTLAEPDSGLCVSRVAVASNDELVCARLPSTFDQDKCYMSLSASGYPGACGMVQDGSLRATCEAVSKFYAAPAGGAQ